MTTQDVVLFGGVGATADGLGATAMNDLWKMNLNPVCDIGLSAIPSASSKCFPCVPGTFYNAGKCNTCAQGSYSKKPGMAQCTACPAGFYGVALGASSLSHCVPCLAGSYSSGTGDIQCRACESANQAFCPLAASKSNNLRPTQAEMTAILPGTALCLYTCVQMCVQIDVCTDQCIEVCMSMDMCTLTEMSAILPGTAACV